MNLFDILYSFVCIYSFVWPKLNVLWGYLKLISLFLVIRLVLGDLPNEIYSKEWDVIMIDGPRGYQPELPGRMAAIYTAAVMARLRTRPGVTHVILHDVNRRVERVYAEKFLCKKHLVKGVERLWHFAIPSATKEETKKVNTFFCWRFKKFCICKPSDEKYVDLYEPFCF